MNHYLFVDAETDGLYGPVFAIAAIILNEEQEEIASFSGKLDTKTYVLYDQWTRENIEPVLDDTIEIYETRDSLLEAFWDFYIKRPKDTFCFADVGYPVEAGLFRECAERDLERRKFQGPYPLLDVSTFLLAAGIDPLSDRNELLGTKELIRHNPLNDTRLSAKCFFKAKQLLSAQMAP